MIWTMDWSNRRYRRIVDEFRLDGFRLLLAAGSGGCLLITKGKNKDVCFPSHSLWPFGVVNDR